MRYNQAVPPIVAKILLVSRVLTSMLPVVVMIALIPLVRNDIVLAVIYTLFILVTLAIRQDRKDLVLLGVGLVIPTIGEILFVATGAEVFTRDVLIFGIPLWLPLLWGYVFVMMRRGVAALERYVR